MTKKPEIPLKYPCQIEFDNVENLNKILLVLDSYDVKWLRGEDPLDYITYRSEGWLHLKNKHRMTSSDYSKSDYTLYTLKDILKL